METIFEKQGMLGKINIVWMLNFLKNIPIKICGFQLLIMVPCTCLKKILKKSPTCFILDLAQRSTISREIGNFASNLLSTKTMPVTDLKSLSDFEVNTKDSKVVVHFWASWAEQCNQVDEILNALSEVHGETIKFLRAEAEEVDDLAKKFEISAVPTVLIGYTLAQ